jgi:urease accessory protein
MADGGGLRQVDIRFARAPDGRAFLARQHVAYPFHVTRTFDYPGDPDGMATLVLQSVGGGLVQGDALALAVHCAEGARAHVTSQAATVAHAMPGAAVRIDQALALDAGCWLEWMPDPLILFPGADVTVATTATLDADATLILTDGFLGHDPTGLDRPFGRIASSLEILDRSGRLVVADRFALDGAAFATGLPGVAGAFRASATMLVVTAQVAPAALSDALAGAFDGLAGVYAGASILPGERGAVARILAADGAGSRAATAAAWRALRIALTGREPQPRRK